MTRLRAILATARAANMPSVVTNVLAGAVLGMATNQEFSNYNTRGYDMSSYWRDHSWSGTLLCLTVLSGLLLYAGGNFLNDWKDAKWDARHRPERAIPRGIISHDTYLILAVLLSAAGCAIPIILEQTVLSYITSAIAVMVLLYTAIHKQTSLAVIPLALCRCGLLALGWFVTSAFDLDHCRDWQHFHLAGCFDCCNPCRDVIRFLAHALLPLSCYLGAMFLYIISLSITARGESGTPHDTHSSLRLPRSLTIFACALAIAPWLTSAALRDEPTLLLVPFAGITPLGIWLYVSSRIFARDTKSMVSSMLGGIPLLDLAVITPAIFLTRWPDAADFSTLPDHTPQAFLYLAIPLAAWALSLILQTLAPAT